MGVQFGIGIGKTFPKMASRFFVFICVATLQCLLAGKVSAFDCSTDGIFPDDSNCAKFIICNGNNTYRLDCPAGLVFNPTALTCDWPEHVPECDVNPTVASIQLKKTDCSTDGIFPDDSNCAKFIICNGNNTYRQDCPAGLVFNPTALTCDWPEHVPECDVNPTVASIQSQKTDCSSDGTFSAEDDCTKFVVCFSGFAETFTCPASTVFNPSSLLCDWPQNVPSCNTGEKTSSN